ncbi:uncharacterized protein [Euwallacea fornicatus]|uniref:uncharacterized protein n=1 Tax=Euwallacea fornicatus TaxID=995702 RepID=UPI00338DF4B8
MESNKSQDEQEYSFNSDDSIVFGPYSMKEAKSDILKGIPKDIKVRHSCIAKYEHLNISSASKPTPEVSKQQVSFRSDSDSTEHLHTDFIQQLSEVINEPSSSGVSSYCTAQNDTSITNKAPDLARECDYQTESSYCTALNLSLASEPQVFKNELSTEYMKPDASDTHCSQGLVHNEEGVIVLSSESEEEQSGDEDYLCASSRYAYSPVYASPDSSFLEYSDNATSYTESCAGRDVCSPNLEAEDIRDMNKNNQSKESWEKKDSLDDLNNTFEEMNRLLGLMEKTGSKQEHDKSKDAPQSALNKQLPIKQTSNFKSKLPQLKRQPQSTLAFKPPLSKPPKRLITPCKTTNPALRNIISPVGVYIKSGPKYCPMVKVPETKLKSEIKLVREQKENIPQDIASDLNCQIPSVIYTPAKYKLVTEVVDVKLPESIKKRVGGQVVTKHEQRVARRLDQSIERRLMESDLSINESVNQDVSILTQKQPFHFRK